MSSVSLHSQRAVLLLLFLLACSLDLLLRPIDEMSGDQRFKRDAWSSHTLNARELDRASRVGIDSHHAVVGGRIREKFVAGAVEVGLGLSTCDGLEFEVVHGI